MRIAPFILILISFASLPAQTLMRASGKLIAAPAASCDPSATHAFACGDLRLVSSTIDLSAFVGRVVDVGGMPSIVPGCGITLRVSEIADSTAKLSTFALGGYRIGRTVTLLTQAPVGSIVVQLFSPGPGMIPALWFGTLFLDPFGLERYAFDVGLGIPLPRFFRIPNDPVLIGLEPQFQAVVVDPADPLSAHLSNDACFTIGG
ncbi:MAG: hypothetical protein Fur0037_17550 [Planctomycetota bacterium]